MAPSTEVISICSLGHEYVWSLTSSLLPDLVSATSYVVYVPDSEVDSFRKMTNPLIEVRSQSSLDRGFTELLSSELSKCENLDRLGWYRQQLFKIEALLVSTADRQVIWDADCVPVKALELFDDRGNPRYMRAKEFHRPYFEMISRLFGLERIQDFSFVIPGFPMMHSWAKEFVDYIEACNPGKTWVESIADATDFHLQSGFSETEMLGTWVANMKKDHWSSFDVQWERLGQSRFGFAKDFEPESLVRVGEAHGLDIISFENWDIKTKKKAKRSRLRKVLKRMNRKKH